MEYKRVAVNFDPNDMSPFFSKQSFDYHYDTLYYNYVMKANNGNQSDFVLGGVQLHGLFFEQLCNYAEGNLPYRESASFINKYFGSFDKFKQEFTNTAMALQGSGWVYLRSDGEIQTIVNHKPTDDVILIIDCWEHSFYLDYGPAKSMYYDDFWDFVDWVKVNERLGG